LLVVRREKKTGEVRFCHTKEMRVLQKGRKRKSIFLMVKKVRFCCHKCQTPANPHGYAV
jgi:hypothetical protein